MAMLFVCPTIPAQTPATVGQWSSAINTNYEAVHVQVLPTGQVLLWSIQAQSQYPQLWDPITGNVVAAAQPGYQIFCTGHSFLANGQLFVTGGNLGDGVGVANASIYDPLMNTWTAVPDMNAGRWYPTNTTLANGDVLVLSGDVSSLSDVNMLPQVWQAAPGTWRNLTTAQLALPLYPRMFLAPNGKVFYSSPDQATRYLDPSGTGTWTAVGNSNFGDRDYGSAVLYAPGKVLIVGGGDPPTATAEVIDLNAQTPSWHYVASMAQARRQVNATILADGKVFITGGSSGSGFDNSSSPVFLTEMWDPATGNFTPMASITAYRGYHSNAALLPDGRVLSAGGDVSGATGEIYSPPYLFKGPRPTVSSAPAKLSYGTTFFVGTPDAATISQVNLIRLSSVTHAFNQDQRINSLNFSMISGGLNVTVSGNPNLAPPGPYLLFLVNSQGVPAIGQMVSIPGNVSPIAAASAMPPSGPAPLAVTFSGGGSSDPDGSIVSYAWNFGDGQTSTSANPTHTFSSVNAYNVTLTVTDNLGATGTAILPITATSVSPAPPTLSSLSPNSGTQGAGSTVILTGSNFQSGATCSFGAGITVTSCVFNSMTQLTAKLSIASGATLGTRNVSVVNFDGQSRTLSGGFSVLAPPQVTGLNPNSGQQGQTLNVTVTGTNFQSGAACSFGGGITVSTCTFNSSTQIVATLSIGAFTSTGVRDVTITNPDSQNATLSGGFSVTLAPAGNIHKDFNYPNRSAFLADSWDFNAKTGGGAVRNTEQTGSLAVSYDQTAHPGTIRVPVLPGDIFASSDNSQNTLLRDLPSDWTSIRLMIGSFTAAANYQQVDLVAYQDDDNYVVLGRMADNTPAVEFYQEQDAVPGADVGFKTLTNTKNLLLRLDRDATAGSYRAYYSTDSGTTWVAMGSLTRTLTTPRLAIHIGANYAGTQPTADLAWAEILRPGAMLAPGLTAVNPNGGTQGQALASVILSGSNLLSGATCNFGAGITVNSCTFNSGTQLTASVSISASATVGTRNVTVTNPDGQSATLSNGFSVTAGTGTPPGLTGVSPNSGAQGQTLASVIMTGSNIVSGATCGFGAGITVNSCTFNSGTQMTANVSIAANAVVGTRSVTVSNPNGQSGTLNNGFSVVAGIPNPPPGLTGVNPNSGTQGQTLASVIITGSNFVSGATCSFGAGITVNSCTFNSAAQLTGNVSIASSAATGTRSVVVTNPDGQSGTLANSFTVQAGTGGSTVHLNFTYANRSALVADSWDFNAKTSAGVLRNTEQTGSLAVSYDQTAHPGTIRVPILRGDIYSSSNNSQNTLLRDLPSDWTSIRLMIGSFTAAANYQQVDLVAYQDDDNYVVLGRMADDSPTVEFYQEQAAVPSADVGFKTLTNTQNLLLRLDRDATAGSYKAYYSTDSGTTWVAMGSLTRTLTTPRLAIHIGANYAGTQPTADLSWVEILRP